MALKRAILDKIHAARVELRANGEKDTQDAVISLIRGSKSTMVKYWQATNPETASTQTANPETALCGRCRRRIATRTKLALAQKRAQGQRTGEIPYGFTVGPDGKTLLHDDGESTLIEFVRHKHSSGASLRRIVAFLAYFGFRTRKGTPLSLTQVHRFVQRIRREEGAA